MSLEVSEMPREDVAEGHEVEEKGPPLAVDIGKRVLALQAIEAYFNKRNMTLGARTQLREGTRYTNQYGKQRDSVHTGAEKTLSELFIEFKEAIRTLTGSDIMAQKGFDQADIDLWETSIKREVNEGLGGVGPKAVARRAQAVEEAKSVTRLE